MSNEIRAGDVIIELNGNLLRGCSYDWVVAQIQQHQDITFGVVRADDGSAATVDPAFIANLPLRNHSNTPPRIMCGWLEKQKQKSSGTVRRYFVLKGDWPLLLLP